MDGINALEPSVDRGIRDADLLSIRSSPLLRETLDKIARECVAYFTTLDSNGRWMLADIGRTSIYMAALVLDARPEGLSMARLTRAAHIATVSRGRVNDFVERALAAREFVIQPGADAWTQRRMTVRPEFVDRLRRRFAIDARGVVRLDPVLAPAPDLLEDEALFRRFLYWIGVFASRGRLSVKGPTPMKLFLHSGGGGRLLMALLAAQAPGRARLLQSAPISRAALARDCSVSRPHVNRLLARAEEAGLIQFVGESQIEIGQDLSDAFEGTLTSNLYVTRAALIAAGR
jgi:hypothetical protein